MSDNSDLRDYLATDAMFGGVVIIAASNYVVCTWALHHVPPFTLIASRYALAVLVMTIYVLKRIGALSRELFRASFMLGAILSVAVVSWQFGIANAGHIGPSAFIVSLDGLMVPLLAAILFGHALDGKIISAIPMALVGLSMLTLKSNMTIAVNDYWFLLSAFFLRCISC